MPKAVLALILLCACTFLLGLGQPAINDADEAFYAEAAREMVADGDWLTPHFNYKDRWQKPILYYWLTAATYRVTGVTEWAARLWAAFAGIGLALLTWGIAREYFRREGVTDTALLAGAIVATAQGYVSHARSALPDLPLGFCITLTVWATLRASLDARRPLGWWVLAVAGAGLGLLMKGPVALAVPAIVLAPIWWRERRRVDGIARGVAVAALVCAAVGVPWYLAMWARHGTPYLESFFIGDNFERFTTSRFNPRRSPGYYPAILLFGLMPWSVWFVALLAGKLPRLRQTLRALTDYEWRLILFWCVMPLIFFTVSVGQQPRYILPVLPPLAVLLAGALGRRVDAAAAGRASFDLRVGTWGTAATIGAIGLAMYRIEPNLLGASTTFIHASVAAIAAAAVVLAWIAATGRWRLLPAGAVGASAVLVLAIQFALLTPGRPEPVEEMAALIHEHRRAGEPVGIHHVFVRNLVFYARHPIVELSEGEASSFLQSPGRVLLVVAADDLGRLQRLSGMSLQILGTVPYLNSARIRIGTLLQPDPALVQTVLVTNR